MSATTNRRATTFEYTGWPPPWHVCERPRATGCNRLHWLAHETKAVALVLYEQLAERPGFVQYRIAV